MTRQNVHLASVDSAKKKTRQGQSLKVILSDKRDINKLKVWGNRNLVQFVEEKCQALHMKTHAATSA